MGTNSSEGIAWSEDGTTWNTPNTPINGHAAVEFYRGHFYALIFGTVLRSTDGEEWENVNSNPSGQVGSIGRVTATDEFIIGSSSSANFPGVYSSRNGLNWQTQLLPQPTGGDTAVSYRVQGSAKKMWIVYTTSLFSPETAAVGSSTNGTDWEILSTPFGDSPTQSIAYGNGRLLSRGRLINQNSLNIFISLDDGKSFESQAASTYLGNTIQFAGGRFFGDLKLSSSLDGINWGPEGISEPNLTFVEIAYGNGRYVAVGRGPDPQRDYVAIWESVAPPILTRQPSDRHAGLGQSTTFDLEMAYSSTPLSYQWRRNGQPISGATSASFSIVTLTSEHAGSYACDITNEEGTVSSDSAQLNVVTADKVSRLVNLSVRGPAGTGSATFITGFVVGGGSTAQSMPLLVRGVGPTLGEFGVSNHLPDPEIDVFKDGGNLIANNDNWSGASTLAAEFARLGAFLFNADNSRDAAVRLADITAGPHSVHTLSQDEQPGIALSEIYDATETVDASSPRLINLSCRALAGSGAETLTGGFVLSGETRTRVMIRAVGPTLADFGVDGTLSDPRVTLKKIETGTNTEISANDDWALATRDTQQQVGAFDLVAGSKDAVLIAELEPGVYSAEVAGPDGETGVVLLEIYELP